MQRLDKIGHRGRLHFIDGLVCSSRYERHSRDGNYDSFIIAVT